MQMSTIPMVALRQIIPIEDVYGAYEVSRVLNGVPGSVTPHFIKKRHEGLEIPYEGLIV